MKRDHFPPDIREFYFDFDWENCKVWNLDIPVESILITDIQWHLDMPFWASVPGKPLFDLVPNDVLRQLDEYPYHREKLEKCDTSFPIDVMWSEGRFVILDGIHRLAKLKMMGATLVRIRKIPTEMIPKIRKEIRNKR